MRIFFRTRKLQRLCEDFKQASKRWGKDAAKKLVMRIDQMKASADLEIFMLVHRRCHGLSGNRKGQYAADLKHPKRLIFCPCDDDGNLMEKREDNPKLIKSVLICEVIDYHG